MSSESTGPARHPAAAAEPDAGDGALTPLRLLLLVLGSMALAEFAVMLVLFWEPSIPRPAQWLLDASLLSAIVFPVLYWLMYVPMSRHIRERKRAEEELRQVNLNLEQLVEERTAELLANDRRVQGEIRRRVSAEGEAWKSHDLLLRVVESSPCLMVIYDASAARCLFVNGRIEDMLGYSPEDAVVGDEDFFRSLLSRDDYASFTASVRGDYAGGRGGTAFGGVVRLRHADGEWRRFRVSTSVLRTHPDGRPREALFSASELVVGEG